MNPIAFLYFFSQLHKIYHFIFYFTFFPFHKNSHNVCFLSVYEFIFLGSEHNEFSFFHLTFLQLIIVIWWVLICCRERVGDIFSVECEQLLFEILQFAV
jgi:hypothetical protein